MWMEMVNCLSWSSNMSSHEHKTFCQHSTFASKLKHNTYVKELLILGCFGQFLITYFTVRHKN
jgi:hypothetical protein